MGEKEIIYFLIDGKIHEETKRQGKEIKTINLFENGIEAWAFMELP